MRKSMLIGAVLTAGLGAGALGFVTTAGADEGPNKVWLCHFEENHDAAQADGSYSDDRNGADPGFFSVKPGDITYSGSTEHLVGDYIVRYDPVTSGLNPGQIALCTGNGGTFELVSVNAIGDAYSETPRGHRAQNLGAIPTYPAGYKG